MGCFLNNTFPRVGQKDILIYSFVLIYPISTALASTLSQYIHKLIILAIRHISESIHPNAAMTMTMTALATVPLLATTTAAIPGDGDVDVLVGIGHARVLDLGGLAVLHAAALLRLVEEDEVHRLQDRGGGRGDEEAEDGPQTRQVAGRVARVKDDGADYVAC